MSEYFCAECGNEFRDAEGYHRISCSKKTEVEVIRAENASLRARVSKREDRVKVLEVTLDSLLRAKDPNRVSNDPAVINGWRTLSPAVPVTPERKECAATPCDIIRAINAERDRTCSILATADIPVEAMRAIIDELHGCPPPQKPEEGGAR